MATTGNNLSPDEKLLFEYTINRDLNSLETLILQNNLHVDVYDEHGMTPLKEAAYKGHREICQLLIDQGANVNCTKHEHGYTALHFAALSGNHELCQLLLDSGAKAHPMNSVNRTPAQMAAFVGNHECVLIINNYIPKSQVDYFTIPHGLEKEPKLPFVYAGPMHKFVLQMNIHPVRVCLNLLPSLVGNFKAVKKVLELMSEYEIKKSHNPNEIMAFKMHYLAYIVGEVMKCKSPSEKPSDQVESFLRKLLVKKRGEEFMDLLIREAVREFPFRECTAFRQMVASLARPDMQAQAFAVVTTTINGPRAFRSETKQCATCYEEKANKKCSKCKQVQYCDRECQRLHWFVHKKECNRNTEELNIRMEANKIN